LNIDLNDIMSLPIWIQLPELNLKYYSMSSLSKIGSLVGIPIKTNMRTNNKSMLNYARLLVNMRLDGPFP